MKAAVFDAQGNKIKKIELPKVFATSFRPDLIKRAVLAMQSHNRQVYGPGVLSGKRTSAHYHGAQDGPSHMKNREMARNPRIHGGPPFLSFTARFSPHTVKGRRAHPPKLERVWDEKINNKERVYAIKSAIAATAMRDVVLGRGHKAEGIMLPIIVEDSFEDVKKSKNVEEFLVKIGLGAEMVRAKEKNVRAGKGKTRGRRYKKKKSVIFIVSGNKGLQAAAKNIAGADVCAAGCLNAEVLAPGTHSGRLAVYTESAVKKLGEIYG